MRSFSSQEVGKQDGGVCSVGHGVREDNPPTGGRIRRLISRDIEAGSR